MRFWVFCLNSIELSNHIFCAVISYDRSIKFNLYFLFIVWHYFSGRERGASNSSSTAGLTEFFEGHLFILALEWGMTIFYVSSDDIANKIEFFNSYNKWTVLKTIRICFSDKCDLLQLKFYNIDCSERVGKNSLDPR